MAHNVDEPCTECLNNHVAVRMKDCIVVVSSSSNFHEIWKYNLWMERWQYCSITKPTQLPSTKGQYGVAIGSVIYLLSSGISSEGDLSRNRLRQCKSMLCKLTETGDNSFEWNTIDIENRTKMPSPRYGYCCWKHGNKMWIFGGEGESPADYLNDYGDFLADGWDSWFLGWDSGWNNQLLCFNPSTQTWINLACSGDVPSPRSYAAAAVMQDKMWLYGGFSRGRIIDDLHELNMHSFEWTQIGKITPICRAFSPSLTQITSTKLVLYSRSFKTKSLRIFDVESYSWRPLTRSATMRRCRCEHHSTITTGLNSDAILLGAHIGSCTKPIFSVMLEPKSLQHLALRTIYEHRYVLPWRNSLPPSLKRNMMGTLNE